ncbi:MAG: helix-turn-helix domain-containing protein [Deltaproteobacteria bacterium]|nr:MAG: helix-turn-helix domain-containing protein [Deltaproteobacteria bacterium]
MEKFLQRNYYQILDVDFRASKIQIKRAFEIAKETYGSDSLAAHSIMSPEKGRRFLSKIMEAYRILIDDDSRRLYDQYLVKTSQEFVGSSEVGLETASPNGQLLPDDTPPSKDPLPPFVRASQLSGTGAEKKTEGDDTLAKEGRYDGPELRRIREEKGIGIRTIAEKTKINITTLKFIEENNFKLLPAPFYVKNFLVQYCRCIELDPEKVTESYMKFYALYKEGKKLFK